MRGGHSTARAIRHITVDEIDFSTWRTAKHLRWFVKQHRVDCCDLQDGLLCWLDDLSRLPVTNAFGE